MKKKVDLLLDDGASIKEDRISNLPDDIIHRILSFLDMRYAVWTCILSPRWKNTWTSMPYINLNSCTFESNRKFAEFVKHVLTDHHRTDVFEVVLRFDWHITDKTCVEDIVNYANLHNARKLTMIWSPGPIIVLPQYFFSSRTLKHLTLEENTRDLGRTYIPESPWDFPALEILKISNTWLYDPGSKSVNLFSKCVNLKDLTLHGVVIHRREIFNVCAPQLVNLTITNSFSFPGVFNVVAPQLKNLTASLTVDPLDILTNCTPLFLPLSTDHGGFNSLEKVNLSFGFGEKEQLRHGVQLLNLFRIICKAKFLNLDVDIIESLKINAKPLTESKRTATIPVQIKNYFLQNSPSASFIVESSEYYRKRDERLDYASLLVKNGSQ